MSLGGCSRRTFLQAALSAAPVLMTRAAGARVVPANDRVCLGHIGVGGQGSGLLNNFLQVDGAQSIAVCDCFESRRKDRAQHIDAFYADKTGKSYVGTRLYADFHELLADAQINAVVIATPDHWHVPIALEAIRAGKDVYVEKPLGVSVAENLALRRAVQQTGAIFQYGTQQRSGYYFWQACTLARNGSLGRVHTIHAWCTDVHSQEAAFTAVNGSTQPIPVPADLDYDRWLGPAAHSPYTADRCTPYGTYHHYDNSIGFIAGWGAHPLDIAQWGIDSDSTAPIEYEGTGVITRGGLFETVCDWDMHCRYANGVTMRFMSDGVAAPVVRPYHPAFRDHGTTFFGDDGWVSVCRSGIYTSSESLLRPERLGHGPRLYQSSNHYRNFIECIRSRRPAISPVEAAVQSDIISHLCDISVRLGRKIRWSPQKEEIIDDATAVRLLNRPRRSPYHL